MPLCSLETLHVFGPTTFLLLVHVIKIDPSDATELPINIGFESPGFPECFDLSHRLDEGVELLRR